MSVSAPTRKPTRMPPRKRPEMKPCVVCGNDILVAARKCTHCDSFQNPIRRNLSFSIPVLSLLIAFFSVLITGGEQLKAWFLGESAKLLAALDGQDRRQKEVVFTVANQGKAAAVVNGAKCETDGPAKNSDGKVEIFFTNSQQVIIRPGDEKRAVFNLVHSVIVSGRRTTNMLSEIYGEHVEDEELRGMSDSIVKHWYGAMCELSFRDENGKTGQIQLEATKLLLWFRAAEVSHRRFFSSMGSIRNK